MGAYSWALCRLFNVFIETAFGCVIYLSAPSRKHFTTLFSPNFLQISISTEKASTHVNLFFILICAGVQRLFTES